MLLLLLLVAASLFGQKLEHVAWTITAEPSSAAPGGKALLHAAGRIDAGWHLYSASTPAGIPTSFQAGPPSIVERVRIFQPPPKRALDPNFGSDTETYEGEITFLVELQIRKDAPIGPAQLTVKGRYQTCTDKQCVASRYEGTAALTIDAGRAASVTIPAGYAEAVPPATASTSGPPTQNQGLAAFLLVAFGFGLASIFTPCVFPMIPITMSYFIKRQSGLGQALIYCLGIVVLFSGLGLAATAILGPFGIRQLGSNPWVNGFITALFVAFGLSLLGAFEITIPSSILTRLNRSTEKGGVAGTLLMGLTFSLASFACVGPFVGTLLAASLGGSWLRPLLGMVTFATGLALPFFWLALFPSYLKRLPRSGGWMSRVKVVLGFVILAASLKYLAGLDQAFQLGFLTRERFLAAWIVLFAMAGLYLLGFLRLEGIKPDEPVGLARLMIGIGFLIFAISLAPGMFGGKLGDLDAYVPAAAGGAGAPGASDAGLVWMKDQYREALARAKRESKLVFVSFTGYFCANCHWMKANMFPRPEIASALQSFVLVELYADGTDAASDENQKLELAMFKSVAQPYYAIVDPDEKVIATFDSATRDPAEFLAFLKKGSMPPASTSAAATSSLIPAVKTLDGAELETRNFSGKVVVVNFWATWCVPCIQEIPGFNKLHRELQSKGVAVLGISMDEEGAERVRPFLKKHPMEYQVALGAEPLNAVYKLDQLPVTLVYDRSGKQVGRFEGFTPEDKLREAVEKAL